MRRIFMTLILLVVATYAWSQFQNEELYELPRLNQTVLARHLITPNIDGGVTLKCDFHLHTIFSDGKVHPLFRVDEAWQDGMDVIAITDHLEWNPYSQYIKGDHNESYNLAKKRADEIGILLVKGCEVSRKKPFGHMNALFIEDANRIVVDDPFKAVDEALSQGAFIMLNHPGWPDNISTLTADYERMMRQGKIHGIEVFNEFTYYPKSMDWCRDYGKTLLACSDAHTSTQMMYGSHIRPITLVFARDRSLDGVKQALLTHRTAIWFDNTLVASEEILQKILAASVTLRDLPLQSNGDRVVELTNTTSIPISIRVNNTLYPVPALGKARIILPKDHQIVVSNFKIWGRAALTIEL